MLSIDEALQLVCEHSGTQSVVECPAQDALGLILAEDVRSDIDSPPFTKSLMDGFAVRNDDLALGEATLRLLEEVSAGQTPSKTVTEKTCVQIMTGAPLPEGAQAVVMVERSEKANAGSVILHDSTFKPNQNVMVKGRELARDEVVLHKGDRINPSTQGLLATVGHVTPRVYRRPSVAILSTGDEIVTPDQVPGPGQIRNSNGSTLRALLTAAGVDVVDLGIAGDRLELLKHRVALGLEHDLLLLSGGVSAGNKDFVPQVLNEHGVQQVFHKVNLKPGKPVWFGKHGRGLVFGLPGNPVSVLACFELFVTTALRKRQHYADPLPAFCHAKLSCSFAYPTSRETLHPAVVSHGKEGTVVEPVEWFGSPDLRALTKANVLLRCPITDSPEHAAGTLMQCLPLSGCPVW